MRFVYCCLSDQIYFIFFFSFGQIHRETPCSLDIFINEIRPLTQFTAKTIFSRMDEHFIYVSTSCRRQSEFTRRTENGFSLVLLLLRQCCVDVPFIWCLGLGGGGGRRAMTMYCILKHIFIAQSNGKTKWKLKTNVPVRQINNNNSNNHHQRRSIVRRDGDEDHRLRFSSL